MLVLAVLAELVLVDRLLLAEAVGAVHGSGPTRASSSSVANIEHGVLLAKKKKGRKEGLPHRAKGGESDHSA